MMTLLIKGETFYRADDARAPGRLLATHHASRKVTLNTLPAAAAVTQEKQPSYTFPKPLTQTGAL